MPAQPNQSLADGITLLGLLCSKGRLGTLEAAERLGWETTRANRMLGTLRDIGFATQNSARQYLPGPGVHILAAQCLRGSGLLSVAMPVLSKVPRKGLGLAIGVLWRGSVCYLLHAGVGESLDDGIGKYTPYAADQSSIGLILEAMTEPDNPRNSAAKRTAARKKGYAVHLDGEGARGSVAVAIPGAAGADPIAGLAFIGDLDKHPAEELAAHATQLAQQISTAHLKAINL